MPVSELHAFRRARVCGSGGGRARAGGPGSMGEFPENARRGGMARIDHRSAGGAGAEAEVEDDPQTNADLRERETVNFSPVFFVVTIGAFARGRVMFGG